MFKKGFYKSNNLTLKVLMFTLCFCLLISAKAYADNESRFAEGITIQGTNEMVLNNEEVLIDVKSGSTTCIYDIYNGQDQKIRAKVLFPVKSASPYEINFNSYVNDNFTLATLSEVNDKDTKYYYSFEVVFEPKKETNIKITYDSLWKFNSDYSVIVGFNKNSGSTYKENIKHTKITFDFGDLLDYYIVSPNDNSTYKKVNSKYIWEATNYLSNDNISLLMRPKLITSVQNNLSYYDTKNSLKDVRVLIDVDSLYTKKDEEKNAVNNAANFLKGKLEELGCEVAISNDIESLEKKIKKEAKFDYVISLICKQAQDPSIMQKEIYIEPYKKGNDTKYHESEVFANYVKNAGTSGVCEYFDNLTNNKILGNNNVLKYIGSLDVAESKVNAPRIIISLGYITDREKVYESYQGIMEKTRLGLVIMNECNKKEESNKQVVVTKNNYKVTQGKKNIFQKIGTKISKFFKYNIITIISSIMIGIGLAIVIFVLISNHFEKKMKISYDDIKRREKALEEKMALIEKTKEENEKHKETLKEILRERLKKLTNKNTKTSSTNDKVIEKINHVEIKNENEINDEIKDVPSEIKTELGSIIIPSQYKDMVSLDDYKPIEEAYENEMNDSIIEKEKEEIYLREKEFEKEIKETKTLINSKLDKDILDAEINADSFMNHKKSDDKLSEKELKKKQKEEKKKEKQKNKTNDKKYFDVKNILDKTKNKYNELVKKIKERKLNKFEKASKGEAMKILRKVNNKNISK